MKGDYSDYAIKVQDNGRWYILHDVDGDGNCFYRALCCDDFFHSFNYHHATLREQLCSHIREAARNNSAEMDVLQALLESSHGPRVVTTVAQYCENMAEDKFYAGIFKACAMMLFFPVRIFIVTAAKTDNSAMGGTTDCFKVWNHLEEILSVEPRLQAYRSYFLKPDPLSEIYILNHIHRRPFVIEPWHHVNHFLWLEPCELSDMRQCGIRAIEKPFELFSPCHGTCGKNQSSTQRTLHSSRKIQHSSEPNKNGKDIGNGTRLRKTPRSRKKRKSQAQQSAPCHAQSASKATEMISRKRRHTSPSKQRQLSQRSKTELVDRCFEQYLSKGKTVFDFLASSDSYPLTENDLEVFLKWEGTPIDPIKQVEVQLVQFIKDNHIASRGGKKLTQELERKRQVSERLKCICVNKTDIYDSLSTIYYITTDARNLKIGGMPLSLLMGDYDVPDDAPLSVWIPLSEWEDFKAGDVMFVGGDFDVTVGDEGYEIHEEGQNFDQDRFADDGSTHEQLFGKGQAVKIKGMSGKYWFACNNEKKAKVLDNEGVNHVYDVNDVTAAAV